MRRSYIISTTLLVILWGLGVVLAESNKEAAARVKAAAELARQAQILRQAVNSNTRSGKTSAAAIQQASEQADSNASMTLEMIAQASRDAIAAARIAQEQATRSESAYVAASRYQNLVQICILLVAFGGFAHAAFMDGRRHRWAVEDAARARAMAAQTQESIAQVEVHTNGMHTQLMKAAKEEGVRQEKAAEAVREKKEKPCKGHA